jgi:hypothetical protein
MEKELLYIVLTLEEFSSMLLGSIIKIYTDHKNHTYSNLNNSRVLQWQLLLEEYDATYHYIQGKNNVLADAFSRLPRMDWSRSEGKNAPDVAESILEMKLFSIADNDEMLDCFLNLPLQNEMCYPLELAWIQHNQFEDEQLNAKRQIQQNMYPVKHINNIPLVCYRDNPAAPENEWRICIPTVLLNDGSVSSYCIGTHWRN